MRKLRRVLGLCLCLGGVVVILTGRLSVGLFTVLIGYAVMEFAA